MLKIFRKYQEESERKWFKTLEQLTKYAVKLKSDVEYLLGCYFSSPDDVTRIMLDNSLTAENLAEHKRLIKLCLGSYYNKESQFVAADTERRVLTEDVNTWIKDWDEIRASNLLKVSFFLDSFS